jgi:serine/threonine-protein kinase
MMKTPREILESLGTHGKRLIDMFTLESKNITALSHPHIVHAYDSGTAILSDAPEDYFVMEYIDGDTAYSISRDAKVSHRHVVDVVQGIARALTYLSQEGIAHRDIKPRNILIDYETKRPYLIDFGIAVKYNEHDAGLIPESPRALCMSGSNDSILGTPAYISPEVIRGHPASDRSDVYSLGVVAWEMLKGKTPFDATSPLKIMQQVRQQGVPRLSPDDAHPQLGEIIYLMTRQDPRQRIRALDVVNALSALPHYALERVAPTEVPANEQRTEAHAGSDFIMYSR